MRSCQPMTPTAGSNPLSSMTQPRAIFAHFDDSPHPIPCAQNPTNRERESRDEQGCERYPSCDIVVSRQGNQEGGNNENREQPEPDRQLFPPFSPDPERRRRWRARHNGRGRQAIVPFRPRTEECSNARGPDVTLADQEPLPTSQFNGNTVSALLSGNDADPWNDTLRRLEGNHGSEPWREKS